jgi:hypothetical protein
MSCIITHAAATLRITLVKIGPAQFSEITFTTSELYPHALTRSTNARGRYCPISLIARLSAFPSCSDYRRGVSGSSRYSPKRLPSSFSCSSVPSPDLMAIADLGEFKFSAIESFSGILHTTVESSIRSIRRSQIGPQSRCLRLGILLIFTNAFRGIGKLFWTQ